MADLIVKNMKGEEVHRVTVTNPFTTIRGTEKYLVVKSGMLRNMSPDFYVDDSEFDKREAVDGN